MHHFVHYHNSIGMGYSASNLPSPRLYTNKGVRKLQGATVWLVSGEGKKSPKTFFLAAAFRVQRIVEGSFEHPDFKNSAHGDGQIYGHKLLLTGLDWFEVFRSDQINFRNSLAEITGSPVVDKFQALSRYAV